MGSLVYGHLLSWCQPCARLKEPTGWHSRKQTPEHNCKYVQTDDTRESLPCNQRELALGV